MTSRSRLLKHLATLLAGFFITILLGLYVTPMPTLGFVLEFHAPVTYNMQGGGPKWQTDVLPLSRTHDIVALQEAGSFSSVPGVDRRESSTNQGRLLTTRWAMGFSNRTMTNRFIYFLETDPTGNCVNLAIVTHTPADEVMTVPEGITTVSRPALGVRLGSEWFFTIHGLSGSGNDDANLLRNIAARVTTPGYYWVVLGDYNRDPAFLDIPRGATIYNSGRATHQNGRELDYAVSNDVVNCNTGSKNIELRGNLLDGRGSDHWPVDIKVHPCPKPNSKASASTLIVMPLGDSITYGIGSSTGNGYRGPLITELSREVESVNFVGSQKSGTMANYENEGHSGWRIDQIDNITSDVMSKYRPNIVTLELGTNDMNQDYEVSTAPDRLRSVIDKTLAASPDTTVLVASLVPSLKPDVDNLIADYNLQIPEIVLAEQDKGKHVAFVDMSAVTTDDLNDNLHPNNSGYTKMASAFNEAILEVIKLGWVADRPAIHARGIEPPPLPAPGGAGWIPLGQIASGVGAHGTNVHFADINGDRLDDYLAVNPVTGAVDAWLNNGGDTPTSRGWLPQGQIASGVITNPRDTLVQFADINGDARSDYLVVNSVTGAVDAWLNNGGDTPTSRGWLPRGRIASGVITDPNSSFVQFADINGDRLADYLLVDAKTGAVDAWLNKGGDTPISRGWIPLGRIASGVSKGAPILFADINGDGRADYLVVNDSSGAVDAWLNNGGDTPTSRGWIPLGQIASGVITNIRDAFVQFADMNGDGRADYLVVDRATGAVDAWLNNGGDTHIP